MQPFLRCVLVTTAMAGGRERLSGDTYLFAEATTPRALPLDNLGLEHLDIVVPDPAAFARFYARIFKTALHQQPVRDTLSYFVLVGDLPADRQVGYIAIGAAAQGLKTLPSDDEPEVVRFFDNNGILVEVMR